MFDALTVIENAQTINKVITILAKMSDWKVE